MPPSSAQLDEAHARFHALVLPHLDRLFGFARRRTASVAEAEDAVQDACVRAWLGFGELRDPARVRPWLYRILRTVLIDAAEREGRRQRLVSITRLEAGHEAIIGGAHDEVFQTVCARLDAEAVRNALAMIPEQFAAAVELHDIDGFKLQEIADVLEIPIGTVMSRVSRGRRLLAGAIAATERGRPAARQARAADGHRRGGA